MEFVASNCNENPSCPHGPCLVFERHSSNGSKSGNRFFACSACRDRSECSFFQWVDQEMSENSKKLWEKIRLEKRPQFSSKECVKRLEQFKNLPDDERIYCRTCSLLLLEKYGKHSKHDLVRNVTSQDLRHPSSLFAIRENNKVEAQYFFAESTVTFIVSLLKELGFSKILSIGTPRIHEYANNESVDNMSSLLMDIDHRYMQFFGPEEFCHYNMFNNYLFNKNPDKKIFLRFLNENQKEKLAIVLDPPFGGLIDPISHTIKQINKWWQNENNTNDNVPILWIFPYFNEARIVKNLPDMKMMDYKVQYINHKNFRRYTKKMSAVRIFTNISAANFVLPKLEGYRFCKECQRYVSQENQHCAICKACTTKHGKTYRHCDECKQCVKPSYRHCGNCNKCGIPSENPSMCNECKFSSSNDVQSDLEKCFSCNSVGHRKRSCPNGVMRKNAKKRKMH